MISLIVKKLLVILNCKPVITETPQLYSLCGKKLEQFRKQIAKRWQLKALSNPRVKQQFNNLFTEFTPNVCFKTLYFYFHFIYTALHLRRRLHDKYFTISRDYIIITM